MVLGEKNFHVVLCRCSVEHGNDKKFDEFYDAAVECLNVFFVLRNEETQFFPCHSVCN